MPGGFSGNLIFAIVARMLCGNHLNMVLLYFFGVSLKLTFNLFFRSICQDLLYAWRKEIRQEENNY